ncbi:MAG TPA: hypothetical protein VNZ50_13130 [Hyphomicrobiaceae bacterium]|nr:hypothetical protein [Hyphomicrobiaceae bacterium]
MLDEELLKPRMMLEQRLELSPREAAELHIGRGFDQYGSANGVRPPQELGRKLEGDNLRSSVCERPREASYTGDDVRDQLRPLVRIEELLACGHFSSLSYPVELRERV